MRLRFGQLSERSRDDLPRRLPPFDNENKTAGDISDQLSIYDRPERRRVQDHIVETGCERVYGLRELRTRKNGRRTLDRRVRDHQKNVQVSQIGLMVLGIMTIGGHELEDAGLVTDAQPPANARLSQIELYHNNRLAGAGERGGEREDNVAFAFGRKR